MADALYIYESPFIVNDNVGNRSTYLLDFLDENDRRDEQKIYGALLKFLLNENILLTNGEHIVENAEKEMSSWLWHIPRMNFRSLVSYQQYAKLMTSLQVRDNYPINQILDLHFRLGTHYDHRILNTLAHRCISSIKLIPYDVGERDELITWEKIHRETPFIWLVILLQTIVRSESKKA